jgi:hypothetical protein
MKKNDSNRKEACIRVLKFLGNSLAHVALMTLLWSLIGCRATKQPTKQPIPISIQYRKISLHPTCLSNERIRVDKSGQIFHSKNTRECSEGQIWSDGWKKVGLVNAATRTELQQTIESISRLALPRKMIDDTAQDGKREELDFTLGTVRHRYVMQNREHQALRKAIRLLWGVLASANIPK